MSLSARSFFLLGFGKTAADPDYPPCEPTFSLEARRLSEKSITAGTVRPAGSPIYYTTDGSLPTESSLRYDRPLTLRSPGPPRGRPFREGQCRAAAFLGDTATRQDKRLPSAVTLRPWQLLGRDAGEDDHKSFFTGILFTEHYPGLAVISLVTDDRNLLDDEMGIFVKAGSGSGGSRRRKARKSWQKERLGI